LIRTGEYASCIHEWGSQAVPADWIAAQLDFMLSWEKEKPATHFLINCLDAVCLAVNLGECCNFETVLAVGGGIIDNGLWRFLGE
jgi:hypothetical protein